VKVVEKELSIHEIMSASREGRLIESFGVATANFLQPITEIVYKDVSIEMTNPKGTFSKYMNDTLY
jgi:branched-chain amino acid aminotransferase